jgi:hypothetical protein
VKGYSQPEAAATHEFSKVKTFWGDAFKFDDETAHFVFADSDTVVVSPQDVANMCQHAAENYRLGLEVKRLKAKNKKLRKRIRYLSVSDGKESV